MYEMRNVRIAYVPRGDDVTQRPAHHVSGLCLLLGSVAVFVFRAAHGDLPAADASAALAFIAGRPVYAAVHLGALLGVLVWVGGLVALAMVFASSVGRLAGWLGTASGLIGAAVYIVDFSIDGYAGRGLAGRWTTASPAQRVTLEQAATTVFQILGGTSLTSIAILWGLPLVLFGLALLWEGFPPWLAWTGLIIGTVTFLAALAQYLQPDLVPGVWIYGGLVSLVQLWSVLLAIAVWRAPDAASGTVSLR
jgi:hypothetical protein